MKNRLSLTLSVCVIFLLSCDGETETESPKSFTLLQSGTTNALYDIQFISEFGFTVGAGGTILKTNDGTTWVSKNSGISNDLVSIFMYDESVGYACGFKASLIKTIDGGNTWETLIFPEKEGGLYGLHFLTAQIGFVATGRGKVYKTTDGGTSWTKTLDNPNDFYARFYFIDDQTGFLVGGGGSASASTSALFKTTSQGNAWETKGSNIGVTINDITFSTNSVGYFVAYEDNLYKTANAGESWSKLQTPVNTNWRSITFVNENTGFAVGDQGRIITTSNSGDSWETIANSTTAALQRIRYNTTKSKIYSVGAGGTILVYTL